MKEKSVEVIIDYDVDPKIGGQQAIFIDGSERHSHNADCLVGEKIIGYRFNKSNQLVLIISMPYNKAIKIIDNP